MLRPATPLTILYFIAFAFLLLSTLSTPVIPAIPLGRYTNGPRTYDFGVFGWCGPDSCTDIALGYTAGQEGDFTLPDTTRHSLSAVLVVHPVAAFFTLICTILSFASHFHKPGRSPKFLMWLLILSFPTLLISLLAFLVDLLLFLPKVQWGGWIVLAATVLIVVCSILTCAIRRTLVSRISRQKRIENNPDMNGETYWQSRQEQQYKETPMPVMMTSTEPTSGFARAESPPPLESSRGMANGKSSHMYQYQNGDRPRPSTDDRVPLNPQNPRAPSVRTTSTGRGVNGNGRVSPVSPMDYDDSPPSGMRRDPSDPRYRGQPQNVRGGPPPFYGRGRGGYPPSRGGYPPMRGGYPPRGAYPPPRGFRGGSGRGGPAGMRGPPPPQQGWYQDSRGMGAVAGGAIGGVAAGAMMARGQRGPPPGYQNRFYEQDPGQDQYDQDGTYDGGVYGGSAQTPRGPPSRGYDEDPYYNASAPPVQDPRYNEPQSAVSGGPGFDRRPSTAERDPASFGFSGRKPSPVSNGNIAGRDRSVSPLPPVPQVDSSRGLPGQAIEMDATSGSPQQATGFSQPRHYNDPIELGDRSPPQRHAAPSTAAAELPTSRQSQVPVTQQSYHRPRKSSDAYYEDVDPRFARDEPHEEPLPQTIPSEPHPSALTPGGYEQPISVSQQLPQQPPPPDALAHQPSASSFYGDAPEHPLPQQDLRPNSSSQSETSDFTSVSQRGINPSWHPAGPVQYGQYVEQPYADVGRGPMQSQKWREQDQVLNTNPDFAVPGAEPTSRVRENRGHSRGGSASGSQGGGYGGGRYPHAI